MKQRSVGVGAVAAFLFTHLAFAGGDVVEEDYKEVPAKAAPMWTGFYLGLNAGYGWGTEAVRQSANDLDAFGATSVADAIQDGAIPASLADEPRGFIGGGQVGYNYQISNAVVGVEADFQKAYIKDKETVVTNQMPEHLPFTTVVEQKLEDLGTVRARVGMLMPANALLVYLTGGWAYGQAELSSRIVSEASAAGPACTGFCGQRSTSKRPTGWAAGGGAEYRFAPNWTARVEYLHYDLNDLTQRMSDPRFPLPSGDPTTVTQKVDFNGNIVRAAVNYLFD